MRAGEIWGNHELPLTFQRPQHTDGVWEQLVAPALLMSKKGTDICSSGVRGNFLSGGGTLAT